jgi:hypothetical protein
MSGLDKVAATPFESDATYSTAAITNFYGSAVDTVAKAQLKKSISKTDDIKDFS